MRAVGRQAPYRNFNSLHRAVLTNVCLMHMWQAGNLNHALLERDAKGVRYSEGQFVVVLDCDMVARPHMLSALLPHFYKQVRPLGAFMW